MRDGGGMGWVVGLYTSVDTLDPVMCLRSSPKGPEHKLKEMLLSGYTYIHIASLKIYR